MQGLSLNFHSDSLFALTDKIKSSVEGRMSWGDTFGIGLGAKTDKHLIIWTPKATSEGDILPGFDSQDGTLTVKMKPRPGAWASWLDEAKIIAETDDDHNKIHRSIQELERNARQIADFADGVVSDITVQHLGRTLTLSELAQEILQVRLTVPSTIKTGGYILAQHTDKENAEIPPVTVIIPEQTHIHQLHLNEDILNHTVQANPYDVALVVLRTHIKQYPDLVDLEYGLTLQTTLAETTNADSLKVFPTAAVYDPLQPETLQLLPIEFTAPTQQIHEVIVQSSEKIETYMRKANRHAYQLMTQFQQGVETRLRALVLTPGQRVHNKVWDELVIAELRNTIMTFIEFYTEYLTEEFEEHAAKAKTETLIHNIDPMIEFWQLEDNQQLTLNLLIQSCYKLTNHVLDRAAGLFHDLIFETDFIQPGLAKSLDLLTFENGEPLDKIYLPNWTRASVRQKISGIALRSTLHATQLERLRTVWLELLALANYTSQNRQDFETVTQPLVDILLSPKTAPTRRRKQPVQQRNQPDFAGFEINEDDCEALLNHVKANFNIIKQWVKNAPTTDNLQQHYANLWTLLLDGKLRQLLLDKFQPTCDINISVPEQTKRLINLTLGSTLIIQNEKDRKVLERNLNRALSVKTGYQLADITTEGMLAIHGDALLASLGEEFHNYHQILEKRASRLTNAPKTRKKQKRGRAKTDHPKHLQTLEAEQEKVTDLIAFLEPYRHQTAIATLATAALNPRDGKLEEIRKKQVLSFDLSELPEIGDTWLAHSKGVDDYPNLRMFLLQNHIPISTTGRILMELRNNFPDELFNHVLGLIQEVKVLQETDYKGEPLNQFVTYISEKVWRWELTQITTAELPLFLKEKVLASAVCYEKEVETLMEYVERYDELITTKLAADADIDKQRKHLEEQFQAILETLL